MEEKKILVTRSSMPPFEEYCSEIKDIWDSHWLTNNGIKHEKLAKELKEYLGTNCVTLFTNGHLALENAIRSLDLKGDVITTPYTFVSTTHAIKQNGLNPIFCDIDINDYTIDVSKIESLITSDTCAIVPVHVYGNVCHVNQIAEIAKKHNLKVIYDAAHAFGERINGKSIAEFGDISMFSFHATKVFNTIEGGALAYDDVTLQEKLNLLKNFGIKNEEEINLVGGNAKMNEFQAAMGLCNLNHLGEEIAKRKKVYERYQVELCNVVGLQIHKIQSNLESNYAYFPVLVKKEYGLDRDELYDILKSHNIFARKYFYPATNAISCYKGCNSTPVADYVSRNIITLPMYADLDDKDISRICKVIKEKC